MTKRLVLFFWRIFDKTAYICRQCGDLKNGFGAKTHDGWACSGRCYELYMAETINGLIDFGDTLRARGECYDPTETEAEM